MLNINDVFFTFQGEGFNWGRRALFVRMPFCNLACPWCDTEYNSFTKWSEDDLKSYALGEDCRFAVITGGEPMMNKHTPRVIEILKELGYEIACETNGTFPIVDGVDFVTCSPKRDADYDIHPDVLRKINELKVVVDEGFDFSLCDKWQEQEWSNWVRLSLSPEYGNWDKSLEMIYGYIKKNPRWRISLQTHKWLGVK